MPICMRPPSHSGRPPLVAVAPIDERDGGRPGEARSIPAAARSTEAASLTRLLKTTLVGGVLFLLPLAIVLMLLG